MSLDSRLLERPVPISTFNLEKSSMLRRSMIGSLEEKQAKYTLTISLQTLLRHSPSSRLSTSSFCRGD